VYQTEREDLTLAVMEDTSVGCFLLGLGFGLVYLRKWGIANAIHAKEDHYEGSRS
jgi:hypothetical protein